MEINVQTFEIGESSADFIGKMTPPRLPPTFYKPYGEAHKVRMGERVITVGWAAMANTRYLSEGYPNYMQDRALVAHTPKGALIAVFDGHGGKDVAECLAEKFGRIFADNQADDPRVHLQKAFAAVNPLLIERKIGMDSGSTAFVCFFPKDGKTFWTASVGDSEARTATRGTLSKPHLWTDPEEIQRLRALRLESVDLISRLESECGVVRYHSDLGINPKRGVAMSRAFGDFNVQPQDRLLALSSEPTIKEHLLPRESIYLGTDGVWDTVTMRDLEQGPTSEKLLRLALKKGSDDNMILGKITIT